MKKLLAALTLTITLTGCNSMQPMPTNAKPLTGEATQTAPVQVEKDVPATRVKTDRYTSLSLEPLPEQLDLLSITISTKIPRSISTVKQSLDFLLLRSGYTLLDLSKQSSDVKIMMANPLPEAHRIIQTMPLRSALKMLTGKAFMMKENDIYRSISFIKRQGV